MWDQFTIEDEGVYYCKECNKIYKRCYELEGFSMCAVCWSDIKFLPEKEILAFIRCKRLKKLKEISETT